MARPSPEALAGPLASGLPLLVAVIGTASAALLVPSEYPVAAAALLTVAWASWLCSCFARRRGRAEGAAAAACVHRAGPPSVVDDETGMGNEHQLLDQLSHQVAVFERYGRPGALVTIEMRAIGFRPADRGELPPSPALHVAAILRDLTRASDILLRVEETRFVAVLAETTRVGANVLIDRIIDRASAEPFARNADGSGIRAQVWAGAAELTPGMDKPLDYLEMALTNMAHRSLRPDGVPHGGMNTFTLPPRPRALGVELTD